MPLDLPYKGSIRFMMWMLENIKMPLLLSLKVRGMKKISLVLLFTIQRFLSVNLRLPTNLDKSLHVGNVFVTTMNNIKTVLKVFDGRYREFLL